MKQCTEHVAAYLLSTFQPPDDGDDGPGMVLVLTRKLGESRSRGSARYGVLIQPGWGDQTDMGWVNLIDARGYEIHWTLQQVASWLIRAVPDGIGQVSIRIDDSTGLGPAWTGQRIAKRTARVQAIDVAALRADAAAKLALADKMADGMAKKDMLRSAAWAMQNAANTVEEIQAAMALPGP